MGANWVLLDLLCPEPEAFHLGSSNSLGFLLSVPVDLTTWQLYLLHCASRIWRYWHLNVNYRHICPGIDGFWQQQVLTDCTARSMIVFWHDDVVCLSVCLSVRLGAEWSPYWL